MEVLSYKPDNFDECVDCASVDEVGERLRQAKPIALDFQSTSQLRKDVLDDARPVLIGNTDLGPSTVDQIPSELESKIEEYFGEELGEYADANKRQADGLSMFVFIDSF